MLEFSSINVLVTLNLKTIQGYEKYMLEYIRMNITDPNNITFIISVRFDIKYSKLSD